MPVTEPDLKRLEGVVAPNVIGAMQAASEALTRVGVRHAVVGGLAVAALGYPRATKDVNFLVGEEAFEHHAGGLISMKPGVPIQAAGVVVDFLSIAPGEEHLEAAVTVSGGVVPAAVLVYLKLKSPRAKDRTDVIELIKAGLDVSSARGYLRLHAPTLVAKLEEAAAAARAEEE